MSTTKYRITNDAEDRVQIDIDLNDHDALRIAHIFALLDNERNEDEYAPIIKITPYNELKSYER